jgi:hypothetical protein
MDEGRKGLLRTITSSIFSGPPKEEEKAAVAGTGSGRPGID